MVRALAISGRGEQPAVQDVPVADPGAGQARVAVEAASINGIDGAVSAGYVWDVMPHTFPVVLGRDFAGQVREVGNDVTSFQPGDRVVGVITGMTLEVGAIADEVTIDAAALVDVPEGVTPAQAAAIGLAGVTARDAIDALSLVGDDVVLVAGATGGVGSFAVQLAAATGARVLATARPNGLDFVRGLGADEVVDHTGDLVAGVRAAAPEGLTAVVHAAGDPALLGGLLVDGGRLASVIGANAEAVGREDVSVIPVMAVATPDKVRSLLDAVAAGTLQVPIARTYSLDESPHAIADFGSPKQGKLIVTVP